MIQQLYEELVLNEKVHKFFKDQNFFKAVKNYLPEVRKLVIEFFDKKGYTFSSSSRAYYGYNDESPDIIDKSRNRKPLSIDEMAELKKYGFKKAEIDKIKPSTLTFDAIIQTLKGGMRYNVDSNDPASVKKYLDELDNRDQFMSSFYKELDKKREGAYKSTLKSTDVESSFFGAQSNRGYSRGGGDLKLPAMKKNGYKYEVRFFTNEEFFVEGHNMIVEIKKLGAKDEDREAKREYHFKVNMMRKIEEVLSDIESKMQKSLERYDKGEDSDTEEKKTEVQSTGRSKTPDPVRIVNNYFSKWYSRTKTGKLREVSTDRMPAEIYMHKDRSSKGEYSTFGGSIKDDTYIMNLKLKLSRMNYDKLVKEYPNIREMHQAFIKAIEELGGPTYQYRDITRLFGDKIFRKEHEKFFDRLKFVFKKLAAEGWIPYTFRGGYKKGDPDRIFFKYNENFKKEYSENSEAAAEKFFNSKQFKEVFNQGIKRKATRLEDVPRIYIKRVLESRVRN